MSEWVSDSLNLLVTFQKGRKVQTSDFDLPGYAPYLGAGAISGKSDGYASTAMAVMANDRDVLMLWDGERSGLVGHHLLGVVSSTVTKLTPNAKIDSTLLYYLLLNNFEWIQNRRTGTGVPHVPKDIGRILQLCYPKKHEIQRRIARILKTIDLAIEKTEALIEKYQQIKAGLMHDLFTRGVTADGQLRPPREQAPELYQHTPIGWIPKEWGYNSLRGIFGANNIVNGPFGSDLLTSELRKEGVPVIYCQDIKPGYFKRVSSSNVTPIKAAQLAFCNVRARDILLAKVGSPPCDSCVYDGPINAVVTQDVIRIRPSSELESDYFSSWFNSSYGRKAIKRISIEGTRERVSLGEFKDLIIPLPSEDEQRVIGQRINHAQTTIAKEMGYLKKLTTEKSGLMHDLLTGKVPVQINEPNTEASA